jgi:DNA-binding NtrC family response regulator
MDTDPTVMLIDDEEMVVTALHSFLQLETQYNILTYTSPSEALQAVEDQDVQVVVADYMMPGLDGITLLTRVRETRPQASRILLTGYADKENAIRGINEAGLFQYLEKPWDNDHLRLVIRNGVERARLIGRLDEQMSALEGANQELAEIRQRLMKTFL